MPVDYRVYVLSGREKAAVAAFTCLALAGIGVLFYKSLIPVCAIVVLYRPLSRYRAGRLAYKRKEKLREEFRDFLNAVSSSVASGRHMEEAMGEAREELSVIYPDDSPIISEIDHMLMRIKRAGDSDAEVINDLARRADIEDISNFARVFATLRESGGDMAFAMTKAARLLSEKINIENDIRTLVSQKKYEGRMITAMPCVIIFFLWIMAPEYLNVMYTTLAGRILMTAALCATFGAYRLIERITRIDV